MNKVLLALLLTFFACKSKKEIDPAAEVLALKYMSDLATVEYTVSKIIKANDDKTWYKLGDRKILMSCEATLKAGVDLSQLSKNDFSISDKNITLNLPIPKLISLNIPPEKIKVEYQQIGVFREPFKTQERDALAAQAQRQIQNSVAQLGIIEQAKANTSLLVSGFLRQAGFQNITITYGTPLPQIRLNETPEN